MKAEIRYYNRDNLEDAIAHTEAVKSSLDWLCTWFTWAKANYCLCDSINFINGIPNQEAEGQRSFVIYDVDDNEFLGSLGLSTMKTYNGERIASISYWRNQRTAKRGFMEDAVNMLISKAYSEFGFTRIEIDVGDCNIPSQQLASKVAKLERDIEVKAADGRYHHGKRFVVP